jgi:MoaA/NifB/PqqE/SkfB family radical SAM enzyme
MSVAAVKKIVREIQHFRKDTSLTLNYEGESLLNPDILDILYFIKDQGLSSWLSTRLFPADEEKLHSLLKTCSTIAVSIEAFSTGENNLFRESEQLNNLENLIRLNERYKKEIAVTAVLKKGKSIQSSEVKQFIGRWIEMVDAIYFWEAIEFGKNHIGFANDLKINHHLARRRPCQQPFNYLAFHSDGLISPCCNTSRLKLSTITINDEFEKIIECQEIRDLQSKHLNNQLAGTVCEYCDLWIDSWLGDETSALQLEDGRTVKLHYEGSSIRIEGSKKS